MISSTISETSSVVPAAVHRLVLRDSPTWMERAGRRCPRTVVFPGDPCNAMYNEPWPVVPTLDPGAAAPGYEPTALGSAAATLTFVAIDGIQMPWVPQQQLLSAHSVDV